MDHLSIRQRLAIWYATLLAVTLVLFSVIVYTFAQTQFETSVNTDLQTRGQAIAAALAHELYAQQAGTIPTPTASPTAAVPTATPRPSGTATTSSATPVATANPQTAANIQNTLKFSVPDVLGRLDTTFEVLNAKKQLQYLTPSLASLSPTGLPLNTAVVDEGMQGTPDTYTTSLSSSLLKIYVQPIAIIPDATAVTPTAGTATTTATSSTSKQIVGLVLVAKPLDDINATLSTLAHLLITGDLIALLFASLGGWFIAGGGLRPIANVTRAARAISANAQGPGLGTRVSYRGARDEVGELVLTFNAMLDAIERVSTAQRRFVADASHELRAPLMTIKGSLELLRRQPDMPDEDRRSILHDAYMEADRMAALVNDLLLLARVDAASSGSYGLQESWLDEQLRGRREVIELDQLVMGVFRHGRAQLQGMHKDLRLAVTTLEPVAVMGDPGQLRQYAIIVLDNAIKYTPSGGTIRLSATRSGDRAIMSISDTGIGIDPADRPNIFERFYRADHARDRDEHGSGLGLAIAKWIATAHRGEIRVESQPGKGTTFTLLLPAMPRGAEQDQRATARRGAIREAHAAGRTMQAISMQAISPLARLARTVSRSGPRSQFHDGGATRGRPAVGQTGAPHDEPASRKPSRGESAPANASRPEVAPGTPAKADSRPMRIARGRRPRPRG